MQQQNTLLKLQEELAAQKEYIAQLEAENENVVSRLLKYEPNYSQNIAKITNSKNSKNSKNSTKSKNSKNNRKSNNVETPVTDQEFDDLLAEIDSNNNNNNNAKTDETENVNSSILVSNNNNNNKKMKKEDYTVLTKEISWNDAKTYIENKEFDKFGRSSLIMNKFIKEIGNYSEYFESSKDKILIFNFNCETRMNSQTHKLEAIIDENNTNKYVFIENDYPYYFTNNIKHYLLFSRIGKLDNNKINNIIIENIPNNNKDNKYDFLYWENPNKLQTLPQLWHVHVIIARKDTLQGLNNNNNIGIVYKDDTGLRGKNIFDMKLCADMVMNDSAMYDKIDGVYYGNKEEKNSGNTNGDDTNRDEKGRLLPDFIKIKELKTSNELINQYNESKEFYERLNELPQLCWNDIACDISKYHYFDKLQRRNESKESFNKMLNENNKNNKEFSEYYSIFGKLLQTYHSSQGGDMLVENNSQLKTMYGIKKDNNYLDIAYILESNKYPFDVVSGINQMVMYTMTKKQNSQKQKHNLTGHIDSSTDAHLASVLSKIIKEYATKYGKLGEFIKKSIHNQEMLNDFKDKLDKNETYRAYSFEIINVPNHLACIHNDNDDNNNNNIVTLAPFIVPNNNGNSSYSNNKNNIEDNNGFEMKIYNIFICDIHKYYDFYNYRISNIRYNYGCVWDTETYSYGNFYTASNFGRSERANRSYVINASKSRGVYCSTKDKILCLEYKCKSEEIINPKNGLSQLKAIIDDTTPDVILVDNIFPYWLLPGQFQYVVFYQGDQLTTEAANKLMIKIVKKNFGLNVNENELMLEMKEEENTDKKYKTHNDNDNNDNNGGDSLIETIKKLKKKKIRDYVWWENPPQFKSIPDLNHVQLIIRNRKLYDLAIKSGYMISMRNESAYSWHKMESMIDKNHVCYYRLPRDETCLREYYRHMRMRLNLYNDLLDIIMIYQMNMNVNCLELVNSMLDDEKEDDGSSKSLILKSRIDRKYISIENKQFETIECGNDINIMYYINKNEFPYYIDCENDILWIVLFSNEIKYHSEAKQHSLTQLIGTVTIESIVKKYIENNKKGKEYLWFENKSKCTMMHGTCTAYQAAHPNTGYFSLHCVHIMYH